MPAQNLMMRPIAKAEATIQSGKARFTVLTDRIIRLEYDPRKKFEDRASQVFWYREQAVPQFTHHIDSDGWLHIETDKLHLSYKTGGEFFWRDLNIVMKETGRQWFIGDKDHQNLKGTARTLDSANGPIPLSDGLISRSGWAVVDDSESLVFSNDAWLEPRDADPFAKDLYFFGFGEDYLDAIKEYQLLTGKPGLLPRWALGNWWSRYWAYTQKELSDLMLEFKAHQIPLSVCIIDMDWHITKTGNTSTGWTGYTWNEALFPDPYGFVKFLHDLNLKTALNLHPAEGVHAHEKAYPLMAKSLDIDPESKKPIEFDIASKAFTKAYFKYLHHPMEEKGIDFWWMDWQQGSKTKTAGLDPLYWLNHLHYYDLGRNGNKRPFVFSRWPGLGGHRYPIGFSGDSIVSWASLAFQPYFTATASNVAFGWWSHDIGGHTEGIEEGELYLRWLQYGVFSPILRLHSTNNPYCERRPWAWGKDIEEAARQAMQLRHQLIPLTYTANWQNAESGEPIILPLYYRWPKEASAYSCPQAYTFCKSMIAAPFTQAMDSETGLTRQVLWLPSGDWYSLFTGEYLSGGSWTTVYGEPQDIPVFMQAGAIIPLNDDAISNGVAAPTSMTIRIAPSRASEFTLYEDDGESMAYQQGAFALTKLSQSLDGTSWQFSISKREGDYRGTPRDRAWNLELFGVSKPDEVAVDGEAASTWEYNTETHVLQIHLENSSCEQSHLITAKAVKILRDETPIPQRIKRIIDHAKLPSNFKTRFLKQLPDLLMNPKLMWDEAHNFTETQLLALFEALMNHQPEPIALDTHQAFSNLMNFFTKLMRS